MDQKDPLLHQFDFGANEGSTFSEATKHNWGPPLNGWTFVTTMPAPPQSAVNPKIEKLQRMVERGATQGERDAAAAAIKRILDAS